MNSASWELIALSQAEETAGMSVEERKAAFEAKFTKEVSGASGGTAAEAPLYLQEIQKFFGSESNHMKRPIQVLVNASSAGGSTQVEDKDVVEALMSLQVVH